eukprot:3077481-Rhodomonas_salina.1
MCVCVHVCTRKEQDGATPLIFAASAGNSEVSSPTRLRPSYALSGTAIARVVLPAYARTVPT